MDKKKEDMTADSSGLDTKEKERKARDLNSNFADESYLVQGKMNCQWNESNNWNGGYRAYEEDTEWNPKPGMNGKKNMTSMDTIKEKEKGKGWKRTRKERSWMSRWKGKTR